MSIAFQCDSCGKIFAGKANTIIIVRSPVLADWADIYEQSYELCTMCGATCDDMLEREIVGDGYSSDTQKIRHGD